MAGTSVASILSECHISVSQEEVLANLPGGWERNGHFSLDETPSQNLLNSSPSRAQNLDTRPPSSYEGDSGSESSESVDGEADMEFTQEPVEWISPSSSSRATVGAEGNDEVAEENDEVAEENDEVAEENDDVAEENDDVAKEDSYVAAFESDRSQSPSQDWHGQIEQPDAQVQTPNFGVSAEFLTQPASGVMDFQFASSEDVEHQILSLETIPEAESQVLPPLLLLPPIPENTVIVIEAPVLAGESCMQPFTQPATETQPLEPLKKIQELANQMQLAEGRNLIVQNPTLLEKVRAGTEEPQPTQQGNSLLLLPPIPENTVSLIETPVLAGESSIQPFTQPVTETQSPEPLNKIQEPANQMQLAEGRNEIVDNPILLDKERAGTEEPQPIQQGSGRDELVQDAPAVNYNIGRTGEQTPQERGGDEHSSDSRQPTIDDGRRQSDKQQERGSHEIPRDIPHVEEVHRGGSGLSEKAQPLTQIREVVEFATGRTPSNDDEQTQRGNGDTKSLSKALKRVDCAEELHGQQKRQRVEASPVRARIFPKTVMDVVRSRSRSFSNSLVDDECNILSIIMRAGTAGRNESASQRFQVLVQSSLLLSGNPLQRKCEESCYSTNLYTLQVQSELLA